MAITLPSDAEAVLVPKKWLEPLEAMAHGSFLPIDFPLPIVVSGLVPDDEIWFAKTCGASGNGNLEIIKKEIIDHAREVDVIKMLMPVTDVDADGANGNKSSKIICTDRDGNRSSYNSGPRGKSPSKSPVIDISKRLASKR